MARSIIKRLVSLIPFIIASLFIISISLISIYSIINMINKEVFVETFYDPYFLYVIKSNILQALISTILCVIIALFIAKALHRQINFWGRKLILYYINISLSLPTITLILGLIIIHGRNGWVNQFLNFAFKTSFHNYINSVVGITIAHLALYLPFATRGFLNYLNSIPSENWKLSSQLGLSSWKIFQYIEWPIIRKSLWQIAVIIYIFCFTSFIIVLILGGGPIITTLEVSIYQAIKLDLNLSQASALSIIQITICLFLLLIVKKFDPKIFTHTVKNKYYLTLTNRNNSVIKFIDLFFVFTLFSFSILPFIAIFKNGLDTNLVHLFTSRIFIQTLKETFGIAFLSSMLSLILAFSLISGAFYFYYNLKKIKYANAIIFLSNSKMLISTYVFITAIFSTLNNFLLVTNYAYYFIIITGALLALPFVVNILWDETLNFTEYEISICEQLNIDYWNFIQKIYFPRIKSSFAYAFSFSMVISYGNFGLIALFNDKNLSTAPYLLYKMLGNYKMEEAISASLIIILISLFIFWIINEIWSSEKQC